MTASGQFRIFRIVTKLAKFAVVRRSAESAAMLADIKRAMAMTAILNRLTFNDMDEVRKLIGNLIGKDIDPGFILIPPFYTTGGRDITLGRNVFINQSCTFYDLGTRQA